VREIDSRPVRIRTQEGSSVTKSEETIKASASVGSAKRGGVDDEAKGLWSGDDGPGSETRAIEFPAIGALRDA